MSRWCSTILILATGLSTPAVASGGRAARVVIPTRFEADRVYVQLRTAAGPTLELYTDTGGGGLIISRVASRRLGLETRPVNDPDVLAELGSDAGEAASPALVSGLPALPPLAWIAPAHQIAAWPEQSDGFLGAPWFSGRIWTWDYPGRHLYLEPQAWTSPRCAHVIPATFKKDAAGARPTSFARVLIRIDGSNVPMLLDTGAETFLTPDALATIRDGRPAFRATSMMMASIFDKLRKAHPDWPVIENAQVTTGAAMMQVRSISVAGWDPGPVWFTRKPDRNYIQFMSSMMSGPVEGSIGGNALRHFVMTLDYPGSRAAFCKVPLG